MSFRPQFVFPVPPDCRDEQFHYFFDSLTTPALSGTIPTLGTVDSIPLLLQPDTEFHWRGIKISGDDGSSLAVMFQDPYGHFLSDTYVPANAYAVPSGIGNLIGSQTVPQESAIICPPGGVIWIYLQNPTAGTYTIDIEVTLLGVKRIRDTRCAA
jgi:hypothetical protein